jgi:hypothetical protein
MPECTGNVRCCEEQCCFIKQDILDSRNLVVVPPERLIGLSDKSALNANVFVWANAGVPAGFGSSYRTFGLSDDFRAETDIDAVNGRAAH